MITLSKVEFDNTIEDFTKLLVENLIISRSDIELIIDNFYCKQHENNNYSFIHIIFPNEISIQFSISYDVFYSVPILNFRTYINDTLTFNLDNIVKKDFLGFNKNVDLQVNAHPILQDLWFSLHPCETHLAMNELLSSSDLLINSQKNLIYLCTWFNIYGLCNIFQSLQFRPNLISFFSNI